MSAAARPNASVDRVFDVLRLVCAAPGELTAADVGRQLGLSPSTTHRLVVTLEDAGFVARDVGARFALGISAHELADRLFEHYGIRAPAQPYLARLAEQSGETASLSVRIGRYAVRIASVAGRHPIHRTLRIGEARPLRRGSAPAVLLPGRAGEAACARGWSAEYDAREALRTLAFAVRDPDDAVIAAVLVEGSEAQFDPDEPQIAGWRAIVDELEAEVAEDAAVLTRDPLAHVDVDDVVLLAPGDGAETDVEF